ncbi:MAG: DNA-processing protein DprA [Bdellovibrionota bacterium]
MEKALEGLRAALALSRVPGIGAVTFQRLCGALGSPVAVWAVSPERLMEVDGVGTKTAQAIREFKEWDAVDRILEEMSRRQIQGLYFGGEGYPSLLAQTEGPPPVLFMKGEILAKDARAAAIVGTRDPDAYGTRVARETASELAGAGFTVVSGFARGIDQDAHAAALDAGGRTIAVLGCGLDVDYPKGSGSLREAVEKAGALVSEFPAGTPPLADNFRQRNRVISGLSLGVVLVQGTAESGARITVNYALEQNRQVFCVPGQIHSRRSEAPHHFLKQGAAPLTHPRDVVEALDPRAASPGPAAKVKRPGGEGDAPADAGLGKEERSVLEVLSAQSPLHRDDLLARAGLDASRGAPVLLRLELNGRVRVEAGGHYSLA